MIYTGGPKSEFLTQGGFPLGKPVPAVNTAPNTPSPEVPEEVAPEAEVDMTADDINYSFGDYVDFYDMIDGGGPNAAGEKYSGGGLLSDFGNSLTDMVDGGGIGKSGDKFSGGGLLSSIGNTVAKPVGGK